MESFQSTRSKSRQAIFLGVGAVCFVVQIAVFKGLVILPIFHGQNGEMVANMIAYTLSALCNYALHVRVTWPDRSNYPINLQMGLFTFTMVIALLANQAIFYICNWWTSPIVATILAIGLTMAAKWYVLDTKVFVGQKPIGYDDSISVAVVMPAFNEEKIIASVVGKAHEYFRQKVDDYRIIIVDDASTDQTGRILDELVLADSRLIVLHHPTNMRYGRSVSDGLNLALQTGMEWLFYTDSDDQFDISEIGAMLDLARKDRADLVIGYREKRADPWLRKLNGFGWTVFCCLVFQIWVRDVDCAFKLIHRRVLESIGPLAGSSATINPELLFKAKQKKFFRTQMGVSHYPRLDGESSGANWSVILDSFRSAIKLRLSK